MSSETNTNFLRQAFVCPHCNEFVQVDIRAEATVGKPVGPNDYNDAWLRGLTDKQKGLLEHAKETGLLAAFTKVMVLAGPVPNEYTSSRAFLHFMQHAVRKPFSSEVSEMIRQEFDARGRDLYALIRTAVVAAVIDGRIVAFFPTGAAIGYGQGKHAKAYQRRPPNLAQLQELIRTKFGYVPRGSLLADELRNRSIGEFANVGLEQ